VTIGVVLRLLFGLALIVVPSAAFALVALGVVG
jgi:hypothetical protein